MGELVENILPFDGTERRPQPIYRRINCSADERTTTFTTFPRCSQLQSLNTGLQFWLLGGSLTPVLIRLANITFQLLNRSTII